MLGFTITKKRLLAMPVARRHKWVALWCRRLYIESAGGSLHPDSLAHCCRLYRRIQNWLQEPTAEIRPDADSSYWTEFFSDRFHHHRRKSGVGISEGDLLPHVRTKDKPAPDRWQPSIRYKVALDNLRSAHNVGSIYRTLDAVGFEGAIVGGSTPGKGNSQVERAAMNSTQWIPQEKAERLAERLADHKKMGYRIVGVETVESSQSYRDALWPEKGVVALGNEEYGLSRDCLKVCDRFVHIPMHGFKNSINVANAFAVVAFHIRCQLPGSKES